MSNDLIGYFIATHRSTPINTNIYVDKYKANIWKNLTSLQACSPEIIQFLYMHPNKKQQKCTKLYLINNYRQSIEQLNSIQLHRTYKIW